MDLAPYALVINNFWLFILPSTVISASNNNTKTTCEIPHAKIFEIFVFIVHLTMEKS